MNAYIYPIIMALVVFPVLAFFITLPYAIWQYRKLGAISPFKVVVFFSFVFYMLTAYFLVILPLPPIESVAHTAIMDNVLLEPLQSLREYMQRASIHLGSFHDVLLMIKSQPFLQLLLNMLMVMPFGFYLRYYFNRKWWQVLLLSFGLSLFFELTQLSGLYGIYPAPYRCFELDDLVTNTFGGMLGFWITPMIAFFLPAKEVIEKKTAQRGLRVSLTRRLCADIVDWAMILLSKEGIEFLLGITYPNGYIENIVSMLLVMLVLTVIGALTGGYTVGKRLCKIRIIRQNGERAGFFRLLLRNFLLYGIILNLLSGIMLLLQAFSQAAGMLQLVCVFSLCILIGMLVTFVLETIIRIFGADKQYIYEKISKTCCVSTLSHWDFDESQEETAKESQQTYSKV